MDDHPRWLVEDEQVVILVDDVQGERLWANHSGCPVPAWFCRRDLHGDAVSGLDAVSRLPWVTVDRHFPGLDEPLSLSSTQTSHTVADHLIKASVTVFDDEGDDRRF